MSNDECLKNDECRMTKQSTLDTFGISHWAFFRHSSLEIRHSPRSIFAFVRNLRPVGAEFEFQAVVAVVALDAAAFGVGER